MTHATSTRTLSTSRRSSSRPVPWPALLIAVAALAALALATYPVRERLFTAVAGLAEGSALASAVGSVAEFGLLALVATAGVLALWCWLRSEEHTSELQSRGHLVCRLLLEKKKNLQLDSALRSRYS